MAEGGHEPAEPVGDAIAGWAIARAQEDAATAALPRPRSVADGAVVELREVTAETVRAICRLLVAPSQRSFVAPNAVSFAEALFNSKAWFRAVYADDVPVGFAMVSVDSAAAEYYLWRFMVAEGFQRRGYGAAAIGRIVEHVRTLPQATALITSWVPAEGGPEPFYRGLGFEPTGEVDDGEVIGRLPL
jgi:diamine N-acetyltransferase